MFKPSKDVYYIDNKKKCWKKNYIKRHEEDINVGFSVEGNSTRKNFWNIISWDCQHYLVIIMSHSSNVTWITKSQPELSHVSMC